MSESEAVYRALGRLWEEGVWLEELGGRFWKLTLQVRCFPFLVFLLFFALVGGGKADEGLGFGTHRSSQGIGLG